LRSGATTARPHKARVRSRGFPPPIAHVGARCSSHATPCSATSPAAAATSPAAAAASLGALRRLFTRFSATATPARHRVRPAHTVQKAETAKRFGARSQPHGVGVALLQVPILIGNSMLENASATASQPQQHIHSMHVPAIPARYRSAATRCRGARCGRGRWSSCRRSRRGRRRAARIVRNASAGSTNTAAAA
jgi:hypothetical protein